MEASEKPQLPFDEGDAGDATVRVLDDRLVIERARRSPTSAPRRLVRERAEAGRPPAETVRKAIEIGTRVLDSEETAANVDYVRRGARGRAGRARSQARRHAGGGRRGRSPSGSRRPSAPSATTRSRSRSRRSSPPSHASSARRCSRTLTAEDGVEPARRDAGPDRQGAGRGRRAPPPGGREAARVARERLTRDAGSGR